MENVTNLRLNSSVLFNDALPDSITICHCLGKEILTRNLILNYMSTIAVRATAFKTSLQYTHDRSRHLHVLHKKPDQPEVRLVAFINQVSLKLPLQCTNVQ